MGSFARTLLRYSRQPNAAPVEETLRQAWERITRTHVGYSPTIPESTLTSYGASTSFPPGNYGPLRAHLGDAGESGWLGLICTWNADAIITNDPRASTYGLAVARISSWIPIHHKSKTTGKLIKFSDFPNASFAVGEGLSNIDIETVPQEWYLDNQHSPHLVFVPFIDAYTKKNVTVCRELLYHMQAWCVHVYLTMPYYGRGFERCIFNTLLGANDVRGSAHCSTHIFQTLAAMQMLAEIDPTYTVLGDQMGPDIVNAVQWNIKYVAESFLTDTPPFNDDAWGGPYYNVDPNTYLKNDFTVFSANNTYTLYHPNDPHLWLGAFQHHYFATAYQFAYGLNQSGYLPVDSTSATYLQKIALACGKLVTRLCGSGTGGTIDYRRGAHQYEIAVGDEVPSAGSGRFSFFTSDAQFIATNFTAQGLGALPNDTEIRLHGTNTILDYFADGYASIGLPSLAMAVRDGVDGAQAAWDRVWNSATFQRSRGYYGENINGIVRKYGMFTPAGYTIV